MAHHSTDQLSDFPQESAVVTVYQVLEASGVLKICMLARKLRQPTPAA
jgi:hypothetical protein